MRHIIITRLFDTGGSNSHFKTMVSYFGHENIILLLEKKVELSYLQSLHIPNLANVEINQKIEDYAHFKGNIYYNLRKLFLILISILKICIIHIRYSTTSLTISATEPEKFLYLLWLPFLKVNYILHTEPDETTSKFTTITLNKTLSSQKKIITVSNSMRNSIAKNWKIKAAKTDNIHVVYNCVSLDKFTPPFNTSKQSNKIILTIGQVYDRKNPGLWLEVAKKITEINKTVKFVWVGDGELFELYKAKTAHLTNILFIGKSNEIQKHLQQATIYYQPSLSESQGIAVLEAMLIGVPCVVSNTGGLPESVIHTHNGLVVDIDDIDAHILAIRTLLEDEQLCSKYAENGKLRYHQYFAYENFEQEMDKIYH